MPFGAPCKIPKWLHEQFVGLRGVLIPTQCCAQIRTFIFQLIHYDGKEWKRQEKRLKAFSKTFGRLDLFVWGPQVFTVHVKHSDKLDTEHLIFMESGSEFLLLLMLSAPLVSCSYHVLA